MVGFVHNYHQIRQIGQIVIKRVAQHFIRPLHIGAFLIELVNIVDKNPNIGKKERKINIFIAVFLFGDYLRGGGKTTQTAKYIFRIFRIAQIPAQFLIDCCTRRDNKEITDIALGIEVSDKRAHEAGFAYASGKGECQRQKFPLKIGTNRVHRVNRAKSGPQIHTLAKRDSVRDFFQNF